MARVAAASGQDQAGAGGQGEYQQQREDTEGGAG